MICSYESMCNLYAPSKTHSLNSDNVNSFFAEVAESDSLLGLTLDLLCSYQRLAPQLFLQVDFNVAKLLPTVTVGEKVMPSDPVVLKKTLQILLEAPTGSLKWKQLVSEAVLH